MNNTFNNNNNNNNDQNLNNIDSQNNNIQNTNTPQQLNTNNQFNINNIEKPSNFNNDNNNNNNTEDEQPKEIFNPYIPDKKNPFNNMNIEFEEIKELSLKDYIVLCWHCKNAIKIEDNWKLFECGNCHRMNKLPQKLLNEIYFSKKLKNYRYNDYMNHLDMILPLPFIMVNCPFCKANNKVKNSVDHCICFVCGNSFNIDYTEENVRNKDRVSLNPNSKYYRYKSQTPEVHRYVPINKIYRNNDYFFPEPINYDNDYYYNYYDRLYYNNFKWDPNNLGKMNFISPNNYYVNTNNMNNNLNYNEIQKGYLLKDKEIKQFQNMNEDYKNKRANILKNLYFMK